MSDATKRAVAACDLQVIDLGDGRYRANCTRCGRSVLTASPRPKYPCRDGKIYKRRRTRTEGVMSCPHRGKVLRQVDCKLCGNREGKTTVYECALFPEGCVISKYRVQKVPERVCITCDRNPNVTPAL